MAPPVIIRAAITKDEWREYRKLAIDKGIAVSELTARLLRAELTRARKAARRRP